MIMFLLKLRFFPGISFFSACSVWAITLTGEEHLVDPFYDGCFFRHDLRLLILLFLIGVKEH